MAFCTQCGASLSGDAEFCTSCGAKASAETAAPAAAAEVKPKPKKGSNEKKAESSSTAANEAELAEQATQAAAADIEAAVEQHVEDTPEAAAEIPVSHTPAVVAEPPMADTPPVLVPAVPYPPAPPITPQKPARAPKEGVVATKNFFFSTILLGIPVIGLLFAIIWACGGCKTDSKRNFARSYLIFLLIGVIVAGISSILIAIFYDQIAASLSNYISIPF